MDTLLRFLYRPVHLRPPGPRARRVLSVLLAGWVAPNVADWATTAAMLARAGSHEDNPLQAALLAHGGVAALAGYKVLAGGVLVTWLGFRLWPRVFIVLMALCELLMVAAVANNVFWLVPHLRKLQLPFEVNLAAHIAAAETLADLPLMRERIAELIAERERLTEVLAAQPYLRV